MYDVGFIGPSDALKDSASLLSDGSEFRRARLFFKATIVELRPFELERKRQHRKWKWFA
ncbi:MAG: hypothetical protein ACI8X5_001759 [Planctomycetota bacterium]|jgi:hypothetical protein